MALAEELDAPISIVVADQTYKLGILDLAGLAAVESEIIERLRQEAIDDLPNTATADDLDRARKSVGKLTIDGLASHAFTLTGAVTFLAHELVKGGSAATVDEARKLAAKLGRAKGWRDLSYLAADASGLFPPRDEAAPPNPPAGQSSPAT